MAAPDTIQKLVETFALHKAHYKSAGYNETELRREFLDPFFKALGWDVDNEAGYADAYKDVIHEDAIKMGGYTKAPDYCFRIGGARKFFVEAKKPSVDINTDVALHDKMVTLVASQGRDFVEHGGFAERLHRVRVQARAGKMSDASDRSDKSDKSAPGASRRAVCRSACE